MWSFVLVCHVFGHTSEDVVSFDNRWLDGNSRMWAMVCSFWLAISLVVCGCFGYNLVIWRQLRYLVMQLVIYFALMEKWEVWSYGWLYGKSICIWPPSWMQCLYGIHAWLTFPTSLVGSEDKINPHNNCRCLLSQNQFLSWFPRLSVRKDMESLAT